MLFAGSKNKKEKKKKSNKVLKTPIALHFYLAFTVIILFFFFSFILGFNQNYENYIITDCKSRIQDTYNSFVTFSKYFVEQSSNNEYTSSNQLRDDLVKNISSSTDISNEATLAVFYEIPNNENKSEYEFVWPSATLNQTIPESVIKAVFRDKGSKPNTKIKSIEIKDDQKTNTYYYTLHELELSTSLYSDSLYVIFYVDASKYYNFANSLNDKMFNTMLFGIIIAGILSVFISLPIITSTQKLSKFAKRISQGEFTPYKGMTASRELCELSDAMNVMATRLDNNDKEQKTFFQNASHELRTPLMSIQGYAEGMKYGVFDKDHEQEAVDIIISETDRLSNMVENLLSISKMDLSAAKGYEVKKTIVNVYELVGVTIEKVRGGFLHNGKELVNDIKIKSNVHIYANENDIFRMLENVFSNCLRYAKAEVRFICYTEGPNVIFEISDDGPGISPEVKEHLFDRFAKGSDGKHGIGLALVLAIAKEHNGTVTGDNKPEGGAIFRISIPTVTANEQLSLINKEKE